MNTTRIIGITAAFILVGAIAGALTGLAALMPLWLGLTGSSPSSFINAWSLGFIATLGAICGALVMPALGWLVIGRVPFWRAVLEPMSGAMLGANALAFVTRSLPHYNGSW